MKSDTAVAETRKSPSLPARGVWVEIRFTNRRTENGKQSLPARGVWVEIWKERYADRFFESLPARGVWVEITQLPLREDGDQCHSPHGECGLK